MNKKIKYSYFDIQEICKFIENDFENQIIDIDFIEVLDFIQIENQNYYFKRFMEKIYLKGFYKYIFYDDNNGINKEWITLKFSVNFENDNLKIDFDKINEVITFYTKDVYIIQKLKNLKLEIIDI